MKAAYTIQPCSEKWSQMSPNPDGTRHCASCQKNLVDFRDMSWKEITRLQKANNHTLCGTYRRSQFAQTSRWKVPFSSAWMTVTSLLLWLSTPKESSASGNGNTYITLPVLQPEAKKDTLLPKDSYARIRGRVTTHQQGDDTTTAIPIANASISVPGTSLHAKTDSLGMFVMDISNYRDTSSQQLILRVSHAQYQSLEVSLIRDHLYYNEILNISLQPAPIYDEEDVSGGIGSYAPSSWFDRLCDSLGW